MGNETPNEALSITEDLEVKFTDTELNEMYSNMTGESFDKNVTRLIDKYLLTSTFDRGDVKLPEDIAYQILSKNLSSLQSKINSLSDEARKSSEEVIAILGTLDTLPPSLIQGIKEFSKEYYNTPILMRSAKYRNIGSVLGQTIARIKTRKNNIQGT